MPPFNRKLHIRVHNEILSEAIQKLAFKYGFSWAIESQQVQYTTANYLVCTNGMELRYDSDARTTSTVYSALTEIDKILAWLEGANKVKQIQVGNNLVTIHRGGDITFGCTLVKAADVKTIFDLWRE